VSIFSGHPGQSLKFEIPGSSPLAQGPRGQGGGASETLGGEGAYVASYKGPHTHVLTAVHFSSIYSHSPLGQHYTDFVTYRVICLGRLMFE